MMIFINLPWITTRMYGVHMAKVTFADLQVYTTLEVEATMPDGEVLVFEHRRPTVAEVRAG